MAFRDRTDAGRRLAARVGHLRGHDLVVLGLPRGGVVVAYEVARALPAPLDVLGVRKLGVPFQPELAMGAVGEDGVRVLDARVLAAVCVSEAELAAVEGRARKELERQTARLRAGRSAIALAGRTAIIVDDGIATGSTMRAACRVARARGAARVVVAVPVAPAEARAPLAAEVDEYLCLETPEPFLAIGEFYVAFTQTTEAEVAALLAAASSRPAPDPPPPPRG